MHGQRFAMLVVVEIAGRRASDRAILWGCRCDCGNETVVATTNLRRGRVKSCGCLRQKVGERQMEHGHTVGGVRSPTFRTWSSMVERCTRRQHKSFPLYGGRGIHVCERWLSFENFLADMGQRPTGTSIDRVDPNGNYEPGNCRWATPKEQGNNRRNNVRFDYRGRMMTVAEIADATGINFFTLYSRLVEDGWPVERATSVPPIPIEERRWGADPTR